MISCQKKTKEELVLELETKELKAGDKYNGINVISYSLKNNSDKIYFINSIFDGGFKHKPSINYKNINLRVYDNVNEVNYDFAIKHKNINDYELKVMNNIYNEKILKSKLMGYNEKFNYFIDEEKYNNFFIYPNQIIYFEFIVNLSKKNDNIYSNSFSYVNFDNNKNYFAKLFMISDSTNYKKNLPREVLKTIKANNVEVYHGIIESKNKVPIKIIN
jgi:hypothetical protein